MLHAQRVDRLVLDLPRDDRLAVSVALHHAGDERGPGLQQRPVLGAWPAHPRGRRAHRVDGGRILAQPADLGDELAHARQASPGRGPGHELGVARLLPRHVRGQQHRRAAAGGLRDRARAGLGDDQIAAPQQVGHVAGEAGHRQPTARPGRPPVQPPLQAGVAPADRDHVDVGEPAEDGGGPAGDAAAALAPAGQQDQEPVLAQAPATGGGSRARAGAAGHPRTHGSPAARQQPRRP